MSVVKSEIAVGQEEQGQETQNQKSSSSYALRDKLYDGKKTMVFSAKDLTTCHNVILKILQKDFETPKDIARMQREFTLVNKLALPSVRSCLGFCRIGGSTALVFEDVGAEPLRKRIGHGPLTLAEGLGIFIGVATCLAELHEKHVIHKDINPDNILLNELSRKVWIIDFDIATQLPRERPSLGAALSLEGTLPYISPEQTGRTAQPLDYRTDFYSLGVTMYEAFTGRLPFVQDDMVELVFAHLALIPDSPLKFAPELPEPLVQIIQKLLEKTPEKRYRSAVGIRADLEECQRQLKTYGRVNSFAIARSDIATQLSYPERPIGRETEIALLVDIFTKIANEGGRRLVLLTGEPGIGKSVLIKEMGGILLSTRATLVQGKFDQLRRDIPYDALIRSFRNHLTQLMAQAKSDVSRWQTAIQKAIGHNGQILVEVIPELATLLGPQPQVATDLKPAEIKNRFLNTFQNFVNAIVPGVQPLVLFFDDLQWADTASLELIQQFLTDPRGRSILIIGSYRSKEVSPGDILTTMLRTTEEMGTCITRIELSPLKEGDVRKLIVNCIGCESPEIEPLAALLSSKTKGNPFFIQQMLMDIYKNGLLYFDVADVKWKFHVEAIGKTGITDNVVELLIGRMHSFDSMTRQALQVGACLGIEFETQDVSQILGIQEGEVRTALDPAIREELLQPIESTYQPALISGDVYDGMGGRLKFAHDRVQEAVYSSLKKEEQQALRLTIGRSLLKKKANLDDDERFEVLSHLNVAVDLIKEVSERWFLAQLNYLAAAKARSAGAYETALNLCQMGIKFLPTTSSNDYYDLVRGLYLLGGECQILLGDSKAAENSFGSALQYCRNSLEVVEVQSRLVMLYETVGRIDDSIESGRKALKLLGSPFPERIGKFRIIAEILMAHMTLSRTSPEKILSLPPVKDVKVEHVLNIYGLMGDCIYFREPEKYPLMFVHIMANTLKYGMSAAAATGILNYTFVAQGVFKNWKVGKTYFELSQQLIDMFPLSLHTAKIRMGLAAVVSWYKPREECFAEFEKIRLACQSRGDYHNAALTLFLRYSFAFLVGVNIKTAAEYAAEYAEFAKFTKAEIVAFSVPLVGGTFALLGKDNIPLGSEITSRLGHVMDNEKEVFAAGIEKVKATYCYYWHFHCMVAYIFEDFEYALAAAEKLLCKREDMIGLPLVWSHALFFTLAAAQMVPKANSKKRRRLLNGMRRNERFLAKAAACCPENFSHQLSLIRAELSRVQGGDPRITASHYQQAIDLASLAGFTNHEAIAAELLGMFYMSRKETSAALGPMITARRSYERWGVPVKVAKIDRSFPDVARFISFSKGGTIAGTVTHTSHAGTYEGNANVIDLPTIIEASQALSSEIVVEHLLEKLMRLLLENSGARYALVIMKKDKTKEFQIAATADVEGGGRIQVKNKPLSEARLCMPILNQVIHTGEAIILADALREGAFISDPYIVEGKCSAILCMPMMVQGKMKGILYLENDLMCGAFTKDKLTLLSVICSQVAISIENANLFDEEKAALDRERRAHEEYVRVEKARLQLASSIEAARAVQEALFVFETEIGDGELRHFYRPAERAGGDWYGYYRDEKHNRIYILLGDVTGHGVPSALVTAVAVGAVTSVIDNLKDEGGELKESIVAIAQAVNRAVLRTRTRLAITMAILAIDVETGHGAYLSAGHPPVFYCGAERYFMMSYGSILGVMKEIELNPIEFTLMPNDFLFLYSDGLLENRNCLGKKLNSVNLRRILTSHHELSHIMDSLTKEVDGFVNDNHLDDTAFMIFKWHG
ncbi:MAG: AAA family ATPase [Oligoflexales bacterium]|nr:AAA family ATPase [Oligoflexales bacterium]